MAVLAVSAVGAIALSASPAAAATSGYKGVNWADSRDNFVNGVLYVSGLSSSDSYASASTVADRVVGQLFTLTGANTVRMPINEPTVSSYWGTYTGAIDKALTKGNVILAYWAYHNGKPDSTSVFNSMWDTVINKYGSNANAYFEVINEPYAYNSTDLNNFYNAWLTRYSSVPRGHVILDGTGYAQNAANVGGDGRLNNTLIAIHDYTFFVSPPYNSEAQWANHLAGYIGSYASRVIVTEFGAAMTTGNKNGVTYNPINYDIPSGSYFADYLRGEAAKLRSLGVGSVYWPGLRDGDWYSLTSKSGSGSSISLSITNQSGLHRIQYAWGGGNAGTTNVKITDRATGLLMDSMGRTANGSNVGQYASSGSNNQVWVITQNGNYVTIKNLGTGLYLDGMGRTSNGSALATYASSGSNNQQWTMLSDGDYVQFQNRATGMIIDGMGRTTNGSDVAQYSNTNSTNQQWRITAA